jgi:hypothetical protein
LILALTGAWYWRLVLAITLLGIGAWYWRLVLALTISLLACLNFLFFACLVLAFTSAYLLACLNF